MTIEIEDVIANFTPEQKEEYFNDLLDCNTTYINMVLRLMDPERRAKWIKKLSESLPDETVIKALPPEERLKGLPPEEIIRAIPSEEVAKMLTLEKQQLLHKLQEKLGQSQAKPTDDNTR